MPGLMSLPPDEGALPMPHPYAPIAYTYDADYHCPDCAESRFGLDDDGFIGVDDEDSEGNPVGIVSPWDCWWNSADECEALVCGDCGEEVDRIHAGECVYSDEDLCTSSERGSAALALLLSVPVLVVILAPVLLSAANTFRALSAI
jgi:hypothetical protein